MLITSIFEHQGGIIHYKSIGDNKVSTYIVMACMKGEFVSRDGNVYDNFQMLGYVESVSAEDAVTDFISQPQFPIVWNDVEYMWSESLAEEDSNGHYGEYSKIYLNRK